MIDESVKGCFQACICVLAVAATLLVILMVGIFGVNAVVDYSHLHFPLAFK